MMCQRAVLAGVALLDAGVIPRGKAGGPAPRTPRGILGQMKGRAKGVSDHLQQAQGVVDCGVGVARGDRVADAKELEGAIGVGGECLGRACDQGVVIDLAEIG